MDGLCDQHEFATKKLNDAQLLCQTKFANLSVVEPPENVRCSQKEAAFECGHENELDYWKLREIIEKQKVNKKMDNSSEYSFHLEVADKEILELMPSVHLLMIEINAQNCLLQNQPRELKTLSFKKLLYYLNMSFFQNTTCSIVKEAFGELKKQKEEFLRKKDCLEMNDVKLVLIFNYTKFLVSLTKFREALDQCENLIPTISSFTYESRISLAWLKYYKLFCAFKIQYVKQEDEVWMRFNSSNLVDKADEVEIRTPPKQNKLGLKKPLPNAPKLKNEFKTEELKDYFSVLSKELYKERPRKNEPNKLSLFDHCENSIKREEDICQEVLWNSEIKKHTPQHLSSTLNAEKHLCELVSSINLEEKSSTKTVSMSLSEISQSLFRNLKYLGSHPPFDLYAHLQSLLAEVSALQNDKFSTAYHFSESANANLFRYKSILLSQRKKELKIEPVLTLEQISFTQTKGRFQDFLIQAPSEWRLVQIATKENGSKIPDLYICRYQKQKEPLFLTVKGNSEKVCYL